MSEIKRPWCCPEPRCLPLHQLTDEVTELARPSPGNSFVCFGRGVREVAFEYDGVDHANDLRSCMYTPLKGLIAWQENADDWRALQNAYGRALAALEEGE